MRFDSVKSLPAKFLLVLGLCNYLFSFAFRSQYNQHVETEAYSNDPEGCTIPGSQILYFYCAVLVLGSGSLVLGAFGLALLWKVINVIPLVTCPTKTVWCKKKWHRVPTTDFSKYKDEFDFEIGFEEEP